MTTTRTAAPAGLPALPELPAFCGPMGDATGDLNRDWTCRYAQRLYHLYSDADNIRRSYRRLATLERRGNTRLAGNLRTWIIEATERHVRHLDIVQERYSVCTHDEPRTRMTFEEALPACTC